jgi:F0F1-type ATP synthase epsilon subunit
MSQTDSKSKEPRVLVKMLSPTQVHYSGYAVSVSAVNSVGPFDILAEHANFFSLLSTGDVVIDTGTQTFRFPTERGIMKVTNNTITLFVDIEPVSNTG